MYVLQHHTRRLLQETASLLASPPTNSTTDDNNNNSNFNDANNDDINSNSFDTQFSPSMAIILVVLLSALFFMAFFSIYVKRCTTGGRNDELRPHTVTPTLPPDALSQGVDPAFLQSLPVVSYKVSKKKGSTAECVVCIAEFEEGEPLRQLPKCKHVFHKECIDMWLSSHTTCPLCRRSVISDGSRSFRWGGSRSLRLSIGRRWGAESERGSTAGPSTPNEGEGSVGHVDEHANIHREALLPRSHSTGHSLAKKAQSGVLRIGMRNCDDADKGQSSTGCLPLTPSAAGFQRSMSVAAMGGDAPTQINVSSWMKGAGASMKRVWSLKRVRPAADPAASSSSAGGAV